ncbi:hypothetical protein ACWGCC_35580, partial [Streptomyces nigrescens]
GVRLPASAFRGRTRSGGGRRTAARRGGRHRRLGSRHRRKAVMPLPPKCPTPDCDDWLWKDTAHTNTDWDNWRWWCCRCRHQWYPTAEQLQEFRYGTSRPAVAHRGPQPARR